MSLLTHRVAPSLSKRPFLIFDAYGTLVELDDFYGHLQRGLARHGCEFSLSDVRRAAHEEMKYYIDRSVLARDRESWLRLRRECAQVLIAALHAQGHQVSLSIEKATQILGDAIHFKAFPETRRVLEKLHRQGVPMGVLSNWDYELPRILESLGLSKYFGFVLSSAELGAQKPSEKVFAAALARVRALKPDVSARDCVYIGDHWEKDVLPARLSGLTPLWIVRHRRDLTSGEAPDEAEKVLRVRSLRPLLRWLRSK
jgi:HAD superfamily hydrolase (TIGR01549 family)